MASAEDLMRAVSTTEEFWDIDGVSLHQYGWNVKTIGGSRYDLPPRRGQNITFAYRPGQVHVDKTPDSRPITLAMWLAGCDPVTGAPVADPALQFNDSWDFIRRLVWKPNGAQIQLTRRWRLSSALGLGTPTLRATGLAEVSDSMTPTMTGRVRADFVMDLLMTDPFFYGDVEAAQIALGRSLTVFNRGHDVAAYTGMSIILTGPLIHPITLTNYSTNPPVSVTYNGDIGIGQSVGLNVSQFQATLVSPGPTSTNVIGNVSHLGSRNWFGLMPGNNALAFQDGGGSGSAQILWKPPYI